jgi:hypothetical protein
MKGARCNSKEFQYETWKEQNKLAIPKIGVEYTKTNKRELILFIRYQRFNSKKNMSKYFKECSWASL